MSKKDKELSFEDFKKEVLNDYYTARLSRELSILGRKEVLTGKAKFGIFGDGKEIAQLALAKVFQDGDFRSGYYRDQTLMLATGMLSPEEFFYQLYGETRVELNPSHGGRSFNNHFGTRSLDGEGKWKDLTKMKNSSPDISPTAGQMPRLLGLAYASKIYRENKELHGMKSFSRKGNEVAFGTIGDSSCAEGHFWETMNAAGVLQVPLAMSIWDDGYGISVPQKYQITKQDLSGLFKGFEKTKNTNGIHIFKERGWDYPALCKMYEEGVEKCRKEHTPVLFHVYEMTQPQGHSTSGSHERYKDKKRLDFEKDFDPIVKMKEWMLEKELADEKELTAIEEKARTRAADARKEAWQNFTATLKQERDELLDIIKKQKTCVCRNQQIDKVKLHSDELKKIINPIRKDNFSTVKKLLRHVCLDCPNRAPLQKALHDWMEDKYTENRERYSNQLYSSSVDGSLYKKEVKAQFSDASKEVPGREILRDNFDVLFGRYPELLTFGEDTGNIGDVNQGLEGLQEKYGELRLTDTGIRETTIIGQAIGLALRGLRPMAEIQYFDYLLYALQTVSDDLATMLYRTKGGQKAPVIIRTRGHRLEGIWHSGSPLSMVINSIRGVMVCVPRNMTQAAGMYNNLMGSDDPALVIEPLNGYRLREKRPDNMGEFITPLGIPEVLAKGTDITLVTYGSCVRIAQDAVRQLEEFNVSVELIDVQTLIPFDTNQVILESIKKTNKVVFFDEDVPGGATAYMLQKVMEQQGAYYYLDAKPRTITAQEHRPAYGTDGDYFSNPNAEDVFETIYDVMHNQNPKRYPKLY